MDEHLLEVKNLKVSFKIGKKKLTAVDDVTFSLDRGKVIGIVGESGCGKSVTATSIMRLVSPSVCEIDENSQILFEGEDLSKASETRMRKVRGNEISMIFQEPMSSLNPVYRIGDQMLEMIRTHHREIPKKEALKQCIEMLSRVGIPSPEQRIKEFPHQMSGGMRQRVMIAMALLCQPKLLIADEPTTALDVTIQAQILQMMRKLKDENDVQRIFEESLSLSGVDYFDFYLLHSIEKKHYLTYEKYHCFDFIKEMKKQGKIKNIGFSFHDTPALSYTYETPAKHF